MSGAASSYRRPSGLLDIDEEVDHLGPPALTGFGNRRAKLSADDPLRQRACRRAWGDTAAYSIRSSRSRVAEDLSPSDAAAMSGSATAMVE